MPIKQHGYRVDATPLANVVDLDRIQLNSGPRQIVKVPNAPPMPRSGECIRMIAMMPILHVLRLRLVSLHAAPKITDRALSPFLPVQNMVERPIKLDEAPNENNINSTEGHGSNHTTASV